MRATGEGMDPTGKTAVVTGGNSGLGEATVHALLAAGANVVSLDLAGGGPAAAAWIARDVAAAVAVETAVAAIEGPFHILDYCAGNGAIGPNASAEAPGDVAAIRQVIEVNLVGAINVTAAV